MFKAKVKAIFQRLPIRRSTGRLRAKFNRALGNPISRKKVLNKKMLRRTLFVFGTLLAVGWVITHLDDPAFVSFLYKLKLKFSHLFSRNSNTEIPTEIHENKKIFSRRVMFVLTVGIPIVLSIVNYFTGNGNDINININPNIKSVDFALKSTPNPNPNMVGSVNLDGYPDDWSEWFKLLIYVCVDKPYQAYWPFLLLLI